MLSNSYGVIEEKLCVYGVCEDEWCYGRRHQNLKSYKVAVLYLGRVASQCHWWKYFWWIFPVICEELYLMLVVVFKPLLLSIFFRNISQTCDVCTSHENSIIISHNWACNRLCNISSCKFFEVGIPVPAAGTMRRTESVSSVSSMSVASTSVAPGQNGVDQPVSNHSATHDEAGILQDFDVASVGSATSGLSTGTLQVSADLISDPNWLCYSHATIVIYRCFQRCIFMLIYYMIIVIFKTVNFFNNRVKIWCKTAQ